MHDVNDELSNLERQRESTQRIVNEIERQIGGLAGQLDRSSAELILAEDNLAERRAVLERRLVDIYKRGPLYTFQALLAAESFGDLLSRYKYLYLTSQQDRALVTDVEKLRNRVVDRAEQHPRRADASSTGRARSARRSSPSTPSWRRRATGGSQTLQRSARSTERRLTALQKDESRLNGLLAALERARRDDAARGALRGAVAGPGLDHHGRPGQARLAGRGHHRLPLRPRHPAERRHHPLERRRDRRGGGHAGPSGGGGQGAAGGTVRHLRPDDRAGARQRLLLGLLPPAVGGGEAGRDGHQGRRRSARWAARTPTTARTCTSRSGARTRSRSIRPTWLRKR